MVFSDKIKTLLLYVIENCQQGDNSITITKFNKMLYFIDFGYYAKFGKSVTELEYARYKFGPVAKGLQDSLMILEEEGLIEKDVLPAVTGSTETKTIFKVKSPGSALQNKEFTENEISVIDATIKHFKRIYARNASDFSHHHYSWICTPKYDTIPYHTAKYCDFSWIGYFHEKDSQEYKSLQTTRKKLGNSDSIKGLMARIQTL